MIGIECHSPLQQVVSYSDAVTQPAVTGGPGRVVAGRGDTRHTLGHSILSESPIPE